MTAFDKNKFVAFLERVKQSNNVKLLHFIEQVGKEYTNECQECKQFCFLYEFGQEKKCKYGIRLYRCIKCRRKSKDLFVTIVCSMKKHTKERNQKGRNHADVVYDAQKLKDLFEQQKGLCYYSGEPMKTKSDMAYDPNVMSIERLNDDIGYVEGNCVFVCFKYQLTTRGVSVEIKREIVKALKTPIKNTVAQDWTKEDFQKTEINGLKYKKRTTREVNGINLQQCIHCEEFKTLGEFHKKEDMIKTSCKSCSNMYNQKRAKTPRGHLFNMIADAKRDAKRRDSRKRKRNDDSGEVDENLFDIVVDKIVEQKGCCALTGFAFVFESNSPFQPSIDRIDNSKGYIKDNFQIVISPVNNAGREKINKL